MSIILFFVGAVVLTQLLFDFVKTASPIGAKTTKSQEKGNGDQQHNGRDFNKAVHMHSMTGLPMHYNLKTAQIYGGAKC